MSHLPPVTWNEVATKDDLRGLEERLRADFSSAISVSEAGLRTEMADLRTEVRTEMADLRTEMRTGMADLRTEMAKLRGDILEGMSRQTRWMFAAAMTWGSVLIATARLLP
jgi:hypothetical protein